jgi:hypothetical protein
MDNLSASDNLLGVKVIVDMGGGWEWDEGGGNLGCVLCCVARVDATHGT